MSNLPTDKIISCFYDSSNDCVKVIDTQGMLLSFNPNGLKVMEIDNEKDVIGKDWLDFWRGSIQPVAVAALKKASAGKVAHFEGYCPTYKGNMRYWEVSIAPLFNDHGDVQWLLVTSRDETDHFELKKLVIKQAAEIKYLRATKLVHKS
jgi:PAS domain S-box-containing protein